MQSLTKSTNFEMGRLTDAYKTFKENNNVERDYDKAFEEVINALSLESYEFDEVNFGLYPDNSYVTVTVSLRNGYKVRIYRYILDECLQVRIEIENVECIELYVEKISLKNLHVLCTEILLKTGHVIYNQWIPCTKYNFWQTENLDIVSYSQNFKTIVCARKDCQLTWDELCKINAQFQTVTDQFSSQEEIRIMEKIREFVIEIMWDSIKPNRNRKKKLKSDVYYKIFKYFENPTLDRFMSDALKELKDVDGKEEYVDAFFEVLDDLEKMYIGLKIKALED